MPALPGGTDKNHNKSLRVEIRNWALPNTKPTCSVPLSLPSDPTNILYASLVQLNITLLINHTGDIL